MNDPATAEIWMMVFGEYFGGMSQGDNKTGQKGTNAMFVMSPSNIPLIPKDRIITYARVVVDTTAHRKKTPIASESQRGVTSSITPANSQQKPRTSQQQNYIEIVCSAHPMQSPCALTYFFLPFCPP
jgi:hypothetical protein